MKETKRKYKSERQTIINSNWQMFNESNQYKGEVLENMRQSVSLKVLHEA
jgi:hypothetical protein